MTGPRRALPRRLPEPANPDVRACPEPASTAADVVLGLQRCGGNRATVAALRNSAASPVLPVVQRGDPTQGEGGATRPVGERTSVATGVERYTDERGLTLYEATLGDVRVTLTATEFAARRAEVADDLRAAADRGRSEAEIHRDVHTEHLAETRGWVGLLSDAINDVDVPSPTMWGPTIAAFTKVEKRLDDDDWDGAVSSLRLALTWLAADKDRWQTYVDESIGGAESLVGTLTVVRDAAVAIEVGLLTGGLAYGLIGAGALGAAGGTVAGVGGFAAAGVALDATGSAFGGAVVGTLSEIADAGLVENLRYAAQGLWGMVVGVGGGLEAMFEGLATLFTDPAAFVEDLRQLPGHVATLWEHRDELWAHFQSLPPEEQAFRVGELFGVIESMLIVTGTMDAAGASLGAELSGAGTGGGGLVPAVEGIAVMEADLLQINAQAAAIFGDVVTAGGEVALMTGGAGRASSYTDEEILQDIAEQTGRGRYEDRLPERGMGELSAEQAKARMAARVAKVEKHHSFFRYLLRAISKAEGKRGIPRHAKLTRMDPAAHQALHELFDALNPKLARGRGVSSDIAKLIENGETTPGQIADLLGAFYRDVHAQSPGLVSARDLAEIDRVIAGIRRRGSF
jgi:hypothetical protein